MIEYHSNVWVKAPEIDINTKSTVLCSASSGTMTLTQTTRDTMCTSGIIGDATSGKGTLFKTVGKMHLYENIHLDIWKNDRYVKDIYQISFSHKKI